MTQITDEIAVDLGKFSDLSNIDPKSPELEELRKKYRDNPTVIEMFNSQIALNRYIKIRNSIKADSYPKYAYGTCDDLFGHPEFYSREEARAAAREDGEIGTVYTCRVQEVSLAPPFDDSDVEERLHDMLYDEIGEAADDFVLSDEHRKSWNTFVDKWIQSVSASIGQFKAVDVEEHGPEDASNI